MKIKKQTDAEWIASVLPASVTRYAKLSFVWRRGSAFEINFTREGAEMLLHFTSETDLTSWCAECQQAPRRIPELFDNRQRKVH